MPAALPTSVPFGRTARRVEWAHLPPAVRRDVEQRIGASVVSASSQRGGYTPGLATVLTDATGGRHFVKAASVKAQRSFAEAIREEARKLACLPREAPAPALLWTAEVDGWVLLSTEYVEARAPRRPWTHTDLAACSDMLVAAATLLTPPPPRLALDSAVDDFAGWPALWDAVRRREPSRPHLDDAAALAARFAEVVAGDTVVHADVRDDNLLLATDGRALLCDWNWPVRGAAWLDSLFLLIGPRGDGLDVESIVAGHPLLASVPPDHVDVVLALVTAYFLRSAAEPPPPPSPHLRDFQRWQGEVCWAWLAERRGWG